MTDAALVQTILRTQNIAYAVTNRALDVVAISGAAARFEMDKKIWVGQSLPDVIPELAGNEAVLKQILAGTLSQLRLPLINRETETGDINYCTVQILPQRGSQAQISGLITLITDATEVGQLEQKLTQQRNELRLLSDALSRQNLTLEAANAELKRLSELKSVFVSIAAHEIRTPLTAITGYVELLLDDRSMTLEDKQRQFLTVVQRNADRLMAITQNLLDATRIEAGQLELDLLPSNLALLVEVVAVEMRPQLDAKNQRLVLNLPADLPLALCDETRTIQILGNLLSNASKYTLEGGEITISMGRAQSEGFLQVTVADTGIGIDSDDQAQLFERFFRAKNVSKTRATGTGLGLSITRSLVELHGGRIWLESTVGLGSQFYITMPMAE